MSGILKPPSKNLGLAGDEVQPLVPRIGLVPEKFFVKEGVL
jgi:hypothetical protein